MTKPTSSLGAHVPQVARSPRTIRRAVIPPPSDAKPELSLPQPAPADTSASGNPLPLAPAQNPVSRKQSLQTVTPTVFKEEILGFLEQKERAALSRTSRYFYDADVALHNLNVLHAREQEHGAARSEWYQADQRYKQCLRVFRITGNGTKLGVKPETETAYAELIATIEKLQSGATFDPHLLGYFVDISLPSDFKALKEAALAPEIDRAQVIGLLEQIRDNCPTPMGVGRAGLIELYQSISVRWNKWIEAGLAAMKARENCGHFTLRQEIAILKEALEAIEGKQLDSVDWEKMFNAVLRIRPNRFDKFENVNDGGISSIKTVLDLHRECVVHGEDKDNALGKKLRELIQDAVETELKSAPHGEPPVRKNGIVYYSASVRSDDGSPSYQQIYTDRETRKVGQTVHRHNGRLLPYLNRKAGSDGMGWILSIHLFNAPANVVSGSGPGTAARVDMDRPD